MKKSREKVFEFKPLGSALRQRREAAGMTREQVSERLDIDIRHLGRIEEEGQYPSFGVLYDLVRMFNVSLDEYVFPEKKILKSTKRRNVDKQLDDLLDNELEIIDSSIKGIIKSRGK